MKEKDIDRRFREAGELLTISRYDLKTAEYLFEGKKYSWAVYAFQQSIEKCSKAVHILDGKGTIETMKNKIGHNTPKLYSKSSNEQLKKTKNIERALQKFPELRQEPIIKDLNLSEYRENNKIIINLFEDIKINKIIISDDKDELNRAIMRIEKLIKDSKEIDECMFEGVEDKELSESMEEYYSFYRKIHELGGKDTSKEIEDVRKIPINVLKKVAEFQIKTIVLGTIINTINLVLTILINPHFEFVRYPEKKNPLKYYTKKNPLIKRFEELLKLHKKNLKLHDKWIKLPSILEDID